MTKVILVTHDNYNQETIRKKVEAEVELVEQDLHSSIGVATLADGTQVRVVKDHSEGPYCDWKHTTTLD